MQHDDCGSKQCWLLVNHIDVMFTSCLCPSPLLPLRPSSFSHTCSYNCHALLAGVSMGKNTSAGGTSSPTGLSSNSETDLLVVGCWDKTLSLYKYVMFYMNLP